MSSSGPGLDLDHRIGRFVADHRVGPLTTATRALVDLCNNKIAIALIGLSVLVAVVGLRRVRAAGVVAVATIGSFVIAEFIKDLIGRPRPPYQLAIAHPAGFSMPSTDAAITAATATALLIVTNWTSPRRRHIATGIASSVVVAIGICLIYLGVHWPSDVLAGWAVGIVVSTLITRLATAGL